MPTLQESSDGLVMELYDETRRPQTRFTAEVSYEASPWYAGRAGISGIFEHTGKQNLYEGNFST